MSSAGDSAKHSSRSMQTYVQVERYTDDGKEPEHLVEPSNIPPKPVCVLVGKRKEQKVEEVDRGKRDGIQEERLCYVRPDLRVAVHHCQFRDRTQRNRHTHLDTRAITTSHLNASSRPFPAALSCIMAVSWSERKFGYAAREEWSVPVECRRDMLGSDLRQTTQDAMSCAVCL